MLCFGVVRPYKGVDVLLEAFRDVDAELWVVGRPLGESMERLRRLAPPGRVRFVPRYVSDRELPAFFRRADLLVLPHRRVDVSGRALRRPRLRQADGALRRGRLPRRGGAHGAGRLVPPEDPEALGAAIRELLADPAARAELGERARAAATGPLLLGPHRGADARALRGAARDEGRVHGQEQALGRPGARLARGARLRGARRGGLGAGRVDRATSSAWTWWRGTTACRSSRERELYERAETGALGEVDLVVSFLFWNRIREPLISLGRVGCLNLHPAPLPDFRGVGGYNVAILEGRAGMGRVLPLRGRAHRHRRPGGGGALRRSTRRRRPPSRSTCRARIACSRCSSG